MSNETDLDWLALNVHAWPESTPHIIPAGDCAFEFGATFCENHVCLYHREFADSKVIHKHQWLARRAELQNKPRFAEHHDAKCFVQNDSGTWFKNRNSANVRPESDGGWFDRDMSCGWTQLGAGEVLGDWRDTLEKRPEEFKPFTCIEDNQDQVLTQQQDNGWFERGELPPVGVVCIFEPGSGSCYFNEYDLKASGKIVKIIAHTRYEHSSCDVAVFRWDLDGCFGVSTGNTQSFRPIRTERDVLIEIIKETDDTDDKIADAILAAGFSLRAK